MKRKIKVIILSVILVAATLVNIILGINVYQSNDYCYKNPKGEDYSVVKEDGRCYIVFDDISKYKIMDCLGNTHSRVAPQLSFGSVETFVDAVTRGNLPPWKKKTMAEFTRDEEGRILSCDFHNLYTPTMPYGCHVNRVFWTGKLYEFRIRSEEAKGSIQLCTEASYARYYDDYVGFFDSSAEEIRETVQLSKEQIIYYTYKSQNMAKVRYSFTEGNKKVYVDKTYKLESSKAKVTSFDIPERVEMYCGQDGQYYIVTLHSFTSAPSDSWFADFGLKKYIDKAVYWKSLL